jgi:hypothetical protein
MFYVEAEVAVDEDGTERAFECLSLIDAVRPDVVASAVASRRAAASANASASAADHRTNAGGRAGGSTSGAEGGHGATAGQPQHVEVR